MASEAAMINQTITKFGYPATMIREYEHWVVLLRPAQEASGSAMARTRIAAIGREILRNMGGFLAKGWDEAKRGLD